MILTANGTFYPTGRAIGAAKASGGVFVSTDTLSGTNTDSVFQSGNLKYAVIHRIFVVAQGTGAATVQIQAAQTADNLTPAYSTTVTGTLIDFTPGVIIPQGFRVVTTSTNPATIHIVYSLLEN